MFFVDSEGDFRNNEGTYMKKIVIGLSVVIATVVIGLGVVYWQELRGVWPAISSPSQSITESISTNEVQPEGERIMQGPLSLPQGFEIEVFADNVPGARVMVRDSFGNFWVSQPNQGTITQLQVEEGVVTGQHVVFKGLNHPHGLAMDPEMEFMMYIAEEDKISRVPLYSDGSMEKIADLPAGGGHSTRTIAVGSDNRLYVSIGSSCNVCREDDPRRAAILSMNRNGSDIQTVATGLRNSVFFDWSPIDGRLWATDNGRDRIGDDIPPDEINIIQQGRNYGWPYCYGKQVHDASFDSSSVAREHCRASIPSYIEIQAHSAALGLAFIPEEGWPEDYWYDLIVAYHGSWNRSEPTGYKLVRHKLDADGTYQGAEDFVTGWLQGGEALGRPVDVHSEPGGILYVSDDKAGVIYRIKYINS